MYCTPQYIAILQQGAAIGVTSVAELLLDQIIRVYSGSFILKRKIQTTKHDGWGQRGLVTVHLKGTRCR